jgi:hypothetical protein
MWELTLSLSCSEANLRVFVKFYLKLFTSMINYDDMLI